MKQKHTHLQQFWSFLLVFAMVFTTAAGNMAIPAYAAEEDGFIEVEVPNGDFESGQASWSFQGKGESDAEEAYWRVFINEWAKNNTTNIYEACNHSDTEETYTVSQTVNNLKPGVYKAAISAAGGNDGGSMTASFTAGGKTVDLKPEKWDQWITYETEPFTIDETGSCDISISVKIKGEYINLDNVKLYRQAPAAPKEVDSIPAISRKIASSANFTAPAQVSVLYTDGTSAMRDVTWDAAALLAVAEAKAGDIVTVPGKVTIDGKEYDASMTIEIIDTSELVQDISNDALGAVDFDANWQFYLATRTPEAADGGFAAAGVKDAGEYTTGQIIADGFDDAGWRTVDVPHDFSIEGEKVSSSQDSQAYLQGGLGYYRKKFTVPAAFEGSRTIAIDFEGVYQNSVIYLNGEEVGSYPNGYTGFALDITKKIRYGSENVLVVKVQNMSPSGRWYTGSGIVRPVHLVIDNLAHFNRNGITLTTPTLESDYKDSQTAYLDVVAEGYSDSVNSNVYMEVSVFDAEGREVAKKSTERTAMNPSTAFSLTLSGNEAIQINNVNLWYPWNIGAPYLYTVKADLYAEENGSDAGYKLIDTEVMEYGFRWASIQETTSDPKSGGLYINGVYTKVQGVDLHHDSGSLGAVSYTDAYDREFSKLMEIDRKSVV